MNQIALSGIEEKQLGDREITRLRQRKHFEIIRFRQVRESSSQESEHTILIDAKSLEAISVG